jgi:hypothetical protein
MKSVALRVLNGPNAQYLLWIRLEQILQVGSDSSADAVIESDPGGTGFLFSVGHMRSGCFVENLDPGSPLSVNDRSVERCRLHNGDVLTAGNVRFLAMIEQETETDAAPEPAPAT